MSAIHLFLIFFVFTFSQNSFLNQSLSSFEGNSPFEKDKQELLSKLYLFAENRSQTQEQLKKLLSMSLKDLMNLKVSVAIGSEQSQRLAPAVTTVITAKQIEAMGALDINDVLESVPGLHVATYYRYYEKIYIFRGIYQGFNPQVLVLVNNIPRTSILLGDRSSKWEVSINEISRIEIIRGPGSALYGAEAFSGVINVITKKAKELNPLKLGARIGQFKTTSFWLNKGLIIGDTKIGLMFDYIRTEGHKEVIDSDAQTILDAHYGTNASLAPSSASLDLDILESRIELVNGNFTLRAGVKNITNMGSGAGIARALDPYNRYAKRYSNLDFTYLNTDIAEELSVTGELSYLSMITKVEKDLILFPKGANIGFGVLPDGLIGNPEGAEDYTRLNFTGVYSGINSHSITIGIGSFIRDMYEVKETKNFGIDPSTGLPIPIGSPLIDVTDTKYTFLPEGVQKNNYIFLQDIIKINDQIELTAGVRYDHFSDYGGTTNPRFAFVWSASETITYKAIYGKAFRTPSYAEARAINNPAQLGNPDIEPEKLENYEVVFDYRPTSMFQFSINGFMYKWINIIQFIPDQSPLTSATAQNFGEQEAMGFEIETSWQLSSSLLISGNFAFQDAENKKTMSKSANAPRKQLYFSANWSNESWQFFTRINSVMDRKRDFGDTRPEIDDYSSVDATIRYKFNKNISFRFSGLNLFDSNQREPASLKIPNDLPLAGRNFSIETRYEF